MSIPASSIVSVNPSVIAAGGTALQLNGLLLSEDTLLPAGAVLSFATAAQVAAYFGATSVEAAFASVYFGGFNGSTVKPGALLFYRISPTAAVSPFVRGGNLAPMTLAELQAITPGTLTLSVNGLSHTSSSINLSGASSFSNAAATITTALASYDASFTGAISTTTLTVSAVASGALAPGQVLTTGGVTAGTTIVSQLTGTAGGIGTYQVSISQTVASTALKAGQTVVTYDSDVGGFVVTGGTPASTASITFGTGAMAAPLKLTAATGATLSQGLGVLTPAQVMYNVTQLSQNWATFTTTLEPTDANKIAYAAWNSAQNNRYVYALGETSQAATQPNDTTTAWYTIKNQGYAGVIPSYQPSETYITAFVMGIGAALNFDQTNGRATYAFRRLDGMTAGVTDATIASNLTANGYNFYGDYATANDQFNFYYPGTISGDFLWADSYVNQIQLNNSLQLALMVLLINSLSIPYNSVGYGMMEAACQTPVNAGLNFGSIRSGVVLSPSQAAAVNGAAGVIISSTLQQRGWYLQVLPASPEVRAARGSPPSTLWYMDGQSIQKINLASIQVQ